MTRWKPDARERLEHSALELFAEHGFAHTTVPQITAHAGLTTRTFFRHFADKREVLFATELQVPALAARMIAEAPADQSPMQIIASNLDAVAAAQFPDSIEVVLARKAIIQSDAGLRERELRMLSALSDALHDGFVARGVDELTATLVSHTTTTVFSVAIGRWLSQGPAPDAVPLPDLLHETLDAYRALMASPDWAVG